jgi:glycosyltransferase involved in cell wall biosynthesis
LDACRRSDVKILVCSAAAPLPPKTGLTLVIEALLAELRGRHDVRVVAYRLPAQDGEAGPGETLIAARPGGLRATLSTLVTGRPRYAAALAPGMREAVRRELETFRPDAVIVLSARLAELGSDVAQLPAIIAPLDAAHLGIQTRLRAARGVKRWLLGIEERRVRRFEATEYRHFDAVVVVSDRDKGAIETLDPSLAVTVIPNGVDVGAFRPDPAVARDPLRIVFTGVMSSPGNIVAAEFAARSVLPLVRATLPGAHLVLVGRSPAARVLALAELDGVEVTGDVPDVRPWLAGSALFLCPMISGTGIKNKLLEAMAVGLPSAATPLGLGGLDVEHEREVLVAEGAPALAAAVIRLLTDTALGDRIGAAAREYVIERHAWSDVARRYERLLIAAGAPHDEADATTRGRSLAADHDEPVRTRPDLH